MRVFGCDHCGQLVFFANSLCLRCRSPLGYLHERRDIVALTQVDGGDLVELAAPVRTWRYCATAASTGCNWLIPAASPGLCPSCVLTRTRPADDDPAGVAEWVKAEAAKRRLVFQLAEIGLPLERRDEAQGRGLAFDLLSSTATKVVTGHDMGLITLDLAEADDEHREHLRQQLAEPYRTVLGHFRHEIGHYYWSVLVDGPDALAACRALFGDDREDYGEAVKRHYADGPVDQADWVGNHVSRYATMHPYEDWAETFAHYLHILDTLQTAASFGPLGAPATTDAADPLRPDGSPTFGAMVDHWLQLSYALNQINQSMGRDDLYPFVLAPAVIRKLAFVDRVVAPVAEAAPRGRAPRRP